MHHLNLEFCNYYEAMEAACRPLQVHIVMHSNAMLLQKMPKRYQGREIGGGGENERRERERERERES